MTVRPVAADRKTASTRARVCRLSRPEVAGSRPWQGSPPVLLDQGHALLDVVPGAAWPRASERGRDPLLARPPSGRDREFIIRPEAQVPAVAVDLQQVCGNSSRSSLVA